MMNTNIRKINRKSEIKSRKKNLPVNLPQDVLNSHPQGETFHCEPLIRHDGYVSLDSRVLFMKRFTVLLCSFVVSTLFAATGDTTRISVIDKFLWTAHG